MNSLISVDEALRLLALHVPSRETLDIPFSQACGLTLASDLEARINRPAEAVSAMDGYAVRLSDVMQPGATLDVIGEAPAGHPFPGTPGPGQAVRVFTGSVIPPGTDHIVIQEDVIRQAGRIICRNAYRDPQFIRRAGLDFTIGKVLLTGGTRLGAAQLSVAAAANHATLHVMRPFHVGILASGDELCVPGSDMKPGQTINSNPAGLGALISSWGAVPVDLGVASDTLDAIGERIRSARDIDIFLAVGGASVGDHDLMQPAFRAAGFRPVFSGVSVKPGKPTWFSTHDRQCVLGLPGNPASAFVCAHLFLRSLLLGRGELELARAVAGNRLDANGNRESFLRAEARLDHEGRLIAQEASDQDSSLITPFLSANILIRRAAGAASVSAGSSIDILVIGEIM